MPRVVSLIASATEIVCALGGRNRLVGRSHECDFPAHVASLPLLTAPKLRLDVGAGEIDRQVRRLVEQALSVYSVDAPALRALAPDVIVTQTQCEVCAVSLADVERALCDWLDGRPQLVVCQPMGLPDVWADIRRVAASIDADAAAEALIARSRARMDAVAARTALAQRPRVACIEWPDPLMAAGNWVPTLVRMAGGKNLLGVEGEHSPWMTFDALAEADPEVIVVMPCGFDLPTTRREMAPLLRHPRWPALRAVRDGRVYLTDGNQYFNRPGPRLVESLEILAELFHPRLFDFGHRAAAWEPL